MVDAVIDAFAGSSKAYAHISGLWIYGENPSIDEESPLNPPPLAGLEGTDPTPLSWARTACAAS